MGRSGVCDPQPQNYGIDGNIQLFFSLCPQPCLCWEPSPNSRAGRFSADSCGWASCRYNPSWCYRSSLEKLSCIVSTFLTSKAVQLPFFLFLHSPYCTCTQFLINVKTFLFKATSETMLCASVGISRWL